MNKKLGLTLTVSLLLGAILIFNFSVIAQSPEYTFQLAHNSDVNHPSHKGSMLFKQLVEERTEGRVKIEVYPNNTLGSPPEYTEQIANGIIALGLSTSGQLQEWVPENAVVMIPFLFSSYQDAHEALDGPAGELLAQKDEKAGFKVLSNWEWGFRQITNNKLPINKPEDISKLKMRVPPEIQLQEMYKALGANTSTIDFSELYMALSQKVVDGQCNPLNTIYHYKFYEVQKYLAITNHIYNTQMLVMSKNIWDTLPADIKRVLEESSQVAGLYVRQITMASEDDLITQLEDKGMDVTRPETGPFKKIMGPAIEAIGKFAGEDFTDKFLKLINNK